MAKQSISFKVTANVEQDQAQAFANDLQQIATKATPKEISLIRKLVNNPMVKAMALAKAGQYLK